MKRTKMLILLTVSVIGLILFSCMDYTAYDEPNLPEEPVSFNNTVEAHFFFIDENYNVPSISWYTYFSKDGENWSKLSPDNFNEVYIANNWYENPVSLDYYYANSFKKEYLYYPVPTEDILIKQFVIFKNKELNKDIFVAVKTMPEDKSDSSFKNGFTRELVPISLKDSLKIGKIDSLISKFGNQKIQIKFSVEKYDPIKTALKTYDSKNGLSYAFNPEGVTLDSCVLSIEDGEISFSRNLSEDAKGNLYLYPADYGRNVKLISVETIK